jgi:hypothetical protein
MIPHSSFMLWFPNSDDWSSFSGDTVKTFMEVFLQHTTNHYDEQSDMLFIYFLSFFCNNFKIIRLSPSGEFYSGSQVMHKRTFPHFLCPQEINQELY